MQKGLSKIEGMANQEEDSNGLQIKSFKGMGYMFFYMNAQIKL